MTMGPQNRQPPPHVIIVHFPAVRCPASQSSHYRGSCTGGELLDENFPFNWKSIRRQTSSRRNGGSFQLVWLVVGTIEVENRYRRPTSGLVEHVGIVKIEPTCVWGGMERMRPTGRKVREKWSKLFGPAAARAAVTANRVPFQCYWTIELLPFGGESRNKLLLLWKTFL